MLIRNVNYTTHITSSLLRSTYGPLYDPFSNCLLKYYTIRIPLTQTQNWRRFGIRKHCLVILNPRQMTRTTPEPIGKEKGWRN